MEPQLPPRLAEARAALTSLTASTAALQREAGLDVEPEAHCAEVLHCGLMEVGDRHIATATRNIIILAVWGRGDKGGALR